MICLDRVKCVHVLGTTEHSLGISGTKFFQGGRMLRLHSLYYIKLITLPLYVIKFVFL